MKTEGYYQQIPGDTGGGGVSVRPWTLSTESLDFQAVQVKAEESIHPCNGTSGLGEGPKSTGSSSNSFYLISPLIQLANSGVRERDQSPTND